MKKETDSRSRFRSIVVIHVFASRVHFLSSVSLRTINRNDATSQCTQGPPLEEFVRRAGIFCLDADSRLFLFLSFDSPSRRIHALRVYNWQFYSGSLSSAFSYSTLFCFTHCSLWNCLATYRKAPSSLLPL